MPRPCKHRQCRDDVGGLFYKPRGIPMHGMVPEMLALDEFEAMRLCDLEGLDQDQAGERLGVSRGTVQRLLQSGRTKLLGAMVGMRPFTVGSIPSCCPHDGATDGLHTKELS